MTSPLRLAKKKKRQHILLKNEIEMIQQTLAQEVYPSTDTIVNLCTRLEELKFKWYKIKKKRIFINGDEDD